MASLSLGEENDWESYSKSYGPGCFRFLEKECSLAALNLESQSVLGARTSEFSWKATVC